MEKRSDLRKSLKLFKDVKLQIVIIALFYIAIVLYHPL